MRNTFLSGSLLSALALWTASSNVHAQDYELPRFEILPLPRHEVSILSYGTEQTRWHFGEQYPRPFFYPFNGPTSGESLTRMGHPGAENHDHHRSIWFAHKDVNGIDFWSESSPARIRQEHWYSYQDGASEGIMASLLGWYDEDGKQVMQQDMIAATRPAGGGAGDNGEFLLEIQITLRPAKDADSVTLGKTNFGLLAVRVSKSLSHHFGGGEISNSEGARGEADIFGKPARWMDYSGPVATGQGKKRKLVEEGITYFDHPDNPRYPSHWHVRSDGWMGASFCMNDSFTVSADSPLTLRYLLHSHNGAYDAAAAEKLAGDFASLPAFEITKATRPHHQYEVSRRSEKPLSASPK